MPRRRPERPVRLDDTLPGASRRLQAALARSGTGSVTFCYRAWAEFVRDPRRHELWHDNLAYHLEFQGGPYDPVWAREWLERAIVVLPRKHARELRGLVDRLDDLF